MTREQLEAIRARWADGPREDWTAERNDSDGWRVVGDGFVIAADLNHRRADFVAHAPDDIEALLEEVARLWASEAAVRALCAEQMIEGADGKPTDADTLWPSEVLSALEGETVRWWERPQTPLEDGDGGGRTRTP